MECPLCVLLFIFRIMKTITAFHIITAGILGSSLTAVAGNEIPRDTSFTTYSTNLKVKKVHPEAVLLGSDLPEGVKATYGEVYTTIKGTPYGDRDLHVDVFRPDDNGIYPALIMIHGGGWNSGDKTLQRPMAERIASHGYVTIPVEYRLIPEAVYPAGLHDIKSAVRWVRANADRLGVDPSRIAVSGCSAGAQLATLVGVTNGSPRHEGEGSLPEVSSHVAAVVNMDGVSTFVSERNITEARDHLRKKGSLPIGAVWLGGLYEDASDNWNEASAVNWITTNSAPICFIHSDLPRYTDGMEYLKAQYDKFGIYTETHAIGSDIHPFWFFNPWVDKVIDKTVRFLDKTLKSEISD